MKVNTVNVEITREDLNVLHATVPEHEVPILLTVFMAGNVRVIGPGKKPFLLEEGVDGEYGRLKRKYRRPGAENGMTQRVYSNAAALAKAIGATDYKEHTGLEPAVSESVFYDGSEEAEEEAPRRRGRPPKVEDSPKAEEVN